MARRRASRHIASRRLIVFTLLIGLSFVALLTAVPAWAERTEVEFGDPAHPMIVGWAGREIRIWVKPLPNEGYRQIARRVMAEPQRYGELASYNGEQPVLLGRSVAFPFRWVKPKVQGLALRALYPGDYLSETGWVHRVLYTTENLIQLAEAFTGERGRYLKLARRNNLSNPDLLPMGMEIVIPHEWIPDALQLLPTQLKSPLVLRQDERTGRRYAEYTIGAGETLYSSVILRFTDRERAAEVRRMAQRLLRLNNLPDASRVPVGKALRIPLEWVAEDYLVGTGPGATARRREAAPPALVPPPRPRPKGEVAPGRRPLHVILDPGHGGVDAGATYGSARAGDLIYEDEVVYDIALRAQRHMEANGHRVYFTIHDPDQDAPIMRLTSRSDRDEVVLVTPPYRIDQASVGINMRVYRIEALYRHLVRKEGVRPEEILLISIHGDALAPTLRGAMAYYPDPDLRHSEFRPHGRVYRLRKEALPASIRFSKAANQQAAERSASFAALLLGELRKQGVTVGRRRAVRSFYYRNDRRTLPAVLRYSRVPMSILLEVGNLNNPSDRRAIHRSQTREGIARGIANAADVVQRTTRPVSIAQAR